MQIQNQIIEHIDVFSLEDSVDMVKSFFKDTTFSHVAIKEGDVFLGVLSEEEAQDFESNKTVADYRYSVLPFFVKNDANWLDVLEVFSRNEANILTVLNDENKILGYYDLSDVVGSFIDTPFFTEPGNIIVVAKGVKDYSFSEIAQIVESNNIKMVGAFITEMRNDVIQITIKIGVNGLNEVLQTFRRYNYTVLFGSKDDQFLEDLKERSDYLEKYLNV